MSQNTTTLSVQPLATPTNTVSSSGTHHPLAINNYKYEELLDDAEAEAHLPFEVFEANNTLGAPPPLVRS